MSDDADQTRVSGVDDDPTRLVREPTRELSNGQVLRERFVIEGKLGEGGMGQVFLARDLQAEKTKPHVALKVLSSSFKDHPQAYAALRREATQSRSLTHSNIVAVFDFDRTQDFVYMVMEYLQGHALDVLIDNRPAGCSLKEAWPVIEGIARGLEYVHQHNVVHADIKPRNIFLTEDGEVKILDLGIARTLDENIAGAGTTRFDPDALGALTPQYASCEMFEGQSPRPQDDIFALGCVTYELLTGKHPFDRMTALEARSMRIEPKRPPGLKGRQWKMLKSCLAMQRADRPASVSDFIRAMSPERSAGSALPWIAVAVVLIGVVGFQVWQQFTVSDDDIVAAILSRYPVDANDLRDASEIDHLFEAATLFKSIGDEQLQAGNERDAIGFWLVSSSSAFRQYQMVLLHTDDPVRRRQAGEEILHMVRAIPLHEPKADADIEELNVYADRLCDILERAPEPAITRRFESFLHRAPQIVEAVADCDPVRLAISATSG
ncbi:MAG: serine/threonine protein kinase [Pseudomonadales bacterium]|nr:serine/threonine protein kinase [Pseudomonadales bacterium]